MATNGAHHIAWSIYYGKHWAATYDTWYNNSTEKLYRGKYLISSRFRTVVSYSNPSRSTYTTPRKRLGPRTLSVTSTATVNQKTNSGHWSSQTLGKTICSMDFLCQLPTRNTGNGIGNSITTWGTTNSIPTLGAIPFEPSTLL
jgi:hypothetical protein